MSRRMSCSMTIDAVRERRKTVTRRKVNTWRTLRPGDRLTLIEKGMGLPKGAQQVVLAEVEVVDVREEPIGALTPNDVRREGFDPSAMSPREFARFWLRSHGYSEVDPYGVTNHHVPCRRIEWRYLDAANGSTGDQRE